ncbi:MAG: VOC family protein [Candidatus Levyibacteriota bacterium]
MKFKPHHITISVKNLNISESFYQTFGFKRVHYWQADDKSLEILHLKNFTIILEIFCYAMPIDAPEHTKNLTTDLQVLGVKHFALQVESLVEAKEFLEGKKIAIVTPITKGRTKVDYFFVKDPDDILVEIVQDDRQY